MLTGGCEALFTPRPLGPLLDIAASRRRPDVATERGASAGDVLGGAGRARLTIVVLEDLHWADEATLDFVQLLGRRVAGMPALVIATYRDDELGRDHPLRVVLGQLSAAHRMHVAPLSAGAVARLARRTGSTARRCTLAPGGNPFFVTEVLARGGASTPGSVRDAVLARAARLPAPARRLLEAVAVARPRAEIWLLERIAPDELPELEACLASGMLRAEGDAVGSGTRSRARRSRTSSRPTGASPCIARRWPRWPGAPSRRGSRITPRPPTTAPPCSSTPRRRASGRRGSAPTARPPPTSPPRCGTRTASSRAARAALLERRSHACFLSGMIQEAVDAETARARDLRRDRGPAAARATRTASSGCSPGIRATARASRSSAKTAIAILETLPPGRELALAYGSRATRSMMAFDLAGTREWGEKAIELAERLGETEVLVAAIGNVGTVELAHGLAEGREKLQRSLELALDARAGAPRGGRVLQPRVLLPRHPRLRHGGERMLEEGRAYCDEHDLLAWDIYLGGWEARIALDHGRWAEAGGARRREPRANARLAAAQPVPLAARRWACSTPAAATPTRGRQLDEALAIAVAANELDTLGPVAIARAEARWLAGEDRAGRRRDGRRAGARASATTIAG